MKVGVVRYNCLKWTLDSFIGSITFALQAAKTGQDYRQLFVSETMIKNESPEARVFRPHVAEPLVVLRG